MPILKQLVTTVLLLGLVLGAVPAAQASSDDAWKELYAKAHAACVKDSQLSDAKVRGETGDFAGAVLLIVDGRHPNGMRGASYCLYDKVTAKTETAAAQITEDAAVPKPAPATGRICLSKSFNAQLKTPRPIGTPCTAKNDEGDEYTGVVSATLSSDDGPQDPIRQYAKSQHVKCTPQQRRGCKAEFKCVEGDAKERAGCRATRQTCLTSCEH